MLLNKDILKCILDVFVLRMGYELSHTVREATSRTTLSPTFQHWWRAMASNCIIHSRNCADTVPSNIGTFGLDDGRDAELFIPLLLLVGECWMSPLFPCSSSCIGR